MGLGHGIQHSSGRLLIPSYFYDKLQPSAKYPISFYPQHNQSYPGWTLHGTSHDYRFFFFLGCVFKIFQR